jgi:DNA-binding transcriptional LysR family regulator
VPNDLHQIDLNLLVACQALLDEASVTRAAARLGVTQSAMSQTLARLRELFADPLLVRKSGRMVPTPLGASLGAPLGRALGEVRALLGQRPSFAPASSRRDFVVATTDHLGAILLPPTWRLLRREAPHVTLDIRTIDARRYARDLESGEHDLAIGVLQPEPGIVTDTLFHEPFELLTRPGHPILARVSARRFAACEHLVTHRSDAGSSIVDVALAQLGLSRRIAMHVQAFALGPPLLVDSDLVMTMPARLSAQFAAQFGLVTRKHPLALPAWPITKAWHRTSEADAAVAWLRDLLRRAAQALD